MSGKGADQRRQEGLTSGNSFGATVVLEEQICHIRTLTSASWEKENLIGHKGDVIGLKGWPWEYLLKQVKANQEVKHSDPGETTVMKVRKGPLC